ncbi:hypothetical protein RCL1_007061 [Eukaryota sp. TZLM3-RCL]
MNNTSLLSVLKDSFELSDAQIAESGPVLFLRRYFNNQLFHFSLCSLFDTCFEQNVSEIHTFCQVINDPSEDQVSIYEFLKQSSLNLVHTPYYSQTFRFSIDILTKVQSFAEQTSISPHTVFHIALAHGSNSLIINYCSNNLGKPGLYQHVLSSVPSSDLSALFDLDFYRDFFPLPGSELPEIDILLCINLMEDHPKCLPCLSLTKPRMAIFIEELGNSINVAVFSKHENEVEQNHRFVEQLFAFIDTQLTFSLDELNNSISHKTWGTGCSDDDMMDEGSYLPLYEVEGDDDDNDFEVGESEEQKAANLLEDD